MKEHGLLHWKDGAHPKACTSTQHAAAHRDLTAAHCSPFLLDGPSALQPLAVAVPSLNFHALSIARCISSLSLCNCGCSLEGLHRQRSWLGYVLGAGGLQICGTAWRDVSSFSIYFSTCPAHTDAAQSCLEGSAGYRPTRSGFHLLKRF